MIVVMAMIIMILIVMMIMRMLMAMIVMIVVVMTITRMIDGDGDDAKWKTFDPNISGAFRRLHAPPSQISNTAKYCLTFFNPPSSSSSSSSLLLKLSDVANYCLLLFQF